MNQEMNFNIYGELIRKRGIHKFHYDLICHLSFHLIGHGFYQILFKLLFEDIYNRKMEDESDNNNITEIIENIKTRILNIKYYKEEDHDTSLKYIIENYLNKLIIKDLLKIDDYDQYNNNQKFDYSIINVEKI